MCARRPTTDPAGVHQQGSQSNGATQVLFDLTCLEPVHFVPEPGDPRFFMTSHYQPAGTVYGTLLNFADEFAAMADQMAQPPYLAPPKAPVLFVKTANTWSASGAAIALPPHVAQVEVGATIGMVIGPTVPPTRGSTRAAVAACYVLMNDLSLPHASLFRPPVKFNCLDGFLGIGSLPVDALRAGDPALFRLAVRINGDLRQTVDFSQLVRSATQLLAEVSAFMSLREGDVLMLGCDTGRPLAHAGDHIEIRAPDHPAFGTLSNTLVVGA